MADYPWLRGATDQSWYDRFLPDHYIPRAPLPIPDRRICLVVGPIQAGRSTLIWRTKSGGEIDLVLRSRGLLVGIEVKAGDPGGRLSRAARSFIDAYQPALFIVVCAEPCPERTEGDTPVRFLRPWEVAPVVARLLGDDAR
jgi:hypothetical protein